MKTTVDEEVDVLRIEGTSLVKVFAAADMYGECFGLLKLSDGRRYVYTIKPAPD